MVGDDDGPVGGRVLKASKPEKESEGSDDDSIDEVSTSAVLCVHTYCVVDAPCQ